MVQYADATHLAVLCDLKACLAAVTTEMFKEKDAQNLDFKCFCCLSGVYITGMFFKHSCSKVRVKSFFKKLTFIQKECITLIKNDSKVFIHPI